MKFKHLLLLVIFSAAIVVRLYNYPNRITFGPEQAISLITSGRMITEKFSLLGNQNLLRQTASGHSFFAGAIFSYTLIPLQVIFNFNAFWISFYFVFLNIFTAAVLFAVTKRILGEKGAMFTLVLFLFCGISIYHSLFIWNQNYAFLLGTLTFYLLYLLRKNHKVLTIILLGFVSGFAYTIQDVYLFTSILVLIIALWMGKKKSETFVYFVVGAALANLPDILFDIRHNFYHIRTHFEYFIDTLRGATSDASLSYYHFLIFLPLVMVIGGFLMAKLYKKNIVLTFLAMTLYIYLNLNSHWVNFAAPTGMPSELTLANIEKAAGTIALDDPKNFNVATLTDFDTRGHILRYPLEFKYKLKPNGVVDYPKSDSIYVLAKNSYDFADSNVWELSTFDRSKVEKLASLSENYSVFKLSK